MTQPWPSATVCRCRHRQRASPTVDPRRLPARRYETTASLTSTERIIATQSVAQNLDNLLIVGVAIAGSCCCSFASTLTRTAILAQRHHLFKGQVAMPARPLVLHNAKTQRALQCMIWRPSPGRSHCLRRALGALLPLFLAGMVCKCTMPPNALPALRVTARGKVCKAWQNVTSKQVRESLRVAAAIAWTPVSHMCLTQMRKLKYDAQLSHALPMPCKFTSLVTGVPSPEQHWPSKCKIS